MTHIMIQADNRHVYDNILYIFLFWLKLLILHWFKYCRCSVNLSLLSLIKKGAGLWNCVYLKKKKNERKEIAVTLHAVWWGIWTATVLQQVTSPKLNTCLDLCLYSYSKGLHWTHRAYSQHAEMSMWESVSLPGASWNLRMVLITSWASFQRFWLCSLTNSQIWLEVKAHSCLISPPDPTKSLCPETKSSVSVYLFTFHASVKAARLPPVNLESI